jgi:hypothetical protein
VLYYRIQGTHTANGGLVPYPLAGERWDMIGVTAFRFANGLIEEEPWAVNSVAAMLSNMARTNARLMIHAIWGGRNDVAPDAKFVIDDQVSDDDKVCTRWRFLSDSRVIKAGMSLFRFDNGLAAEQWEMRG